MMKRMSTILLSALFVLLTTSLLARPNVVLIFCDDLGYGDLSSYGHPLIHTPVLDRMADEGLRLTSFYAAAAVCTPSRAALLTGRYPFRSVDRNFGPGSEDGLPLDEVTLADILKANGYRTAAIGKWHLGHQGAYHPIHRGFDHFFGIGYSNDMLRPFVPNTPEHLKLMLYEDENPIRELGLEQDNLTVELTERAVRFIRESADAPFFLYMAHPMPHMPVATADRFKGQSAGGHYGDVIETLDWSAGQILQTLRELGLEDDTLIIFTSDNGPWRSAPDRMLVQGNEPWHAGSSGLLRGSKAMTYEGGLRVPGILYWPGTLPAGRVRSEMATTLDLFTTIVHLTGSHLPEDRIIDGLDLTAFLMEDAVSPRDEFFYIHIRQLQAIRSGDWKLRVTEQDGRQLFNLRVDPSEDYNVYHRYPQISASLLQKLKAFHAENEANLLPFEP